MKKQTVLLAIVMMVGLFVGALAQHLYTLNPNETIDVSGNGCTPKVVPSLSPLVVRVKCVP